MNLNETSLLAFSREHIPYEINTLYSALALNIEGDSPWETTLRNVRLESLTLHARALYQFLYFDQQMKPDDALAIHFFDNPANWLEKRPSATPALKGIARRVGKEIAHLTYSRLEVGTEGKGWNFVKIGRDLLNALDKFAMHASSSKLSPRTVEAVKHWKKFSGA